MSQKTTKETPPICCLFNVHDEKGATFKNANGLLNNVYHILVKASYSLVEYQLGLKSIR